MSPPDAPSTEQTSDHHNAVPAKQPVTDENDNSTLQNKDNDTLKSQTPEDLIDFGHEPSTTIQKSHATVGQLESNPESSLNGESKAGDNQINGLATQPSQGLGINMLDVNTTTAAAREEDKATTPVLQPDIRSSPPPTPPPKDRKYATESLTEVLSRDDQEAQEANLEAEGVTGDSKEAASEEQVFDDSRSEIHSIMEQFEDGMGGPGEDEIMSPRIGRAGATFTQTSHPPRKSSLEPLSSSTASIGDEGRKLSDTFDVRPPRTSSLVSLNSLSSLRKSSNPQESTEAPLTPSMSRNLPPPPQPDPEPDLPFDFHRFLEQLRHRTADPVAKYLRSFLLEFAKRQWLVHEQVKLISDFLEFISKKMAQCEVWRNVSDAEFDNAREGMEKLVMNRLYNQTFSPAIPAADPITGLKGKRRAGQPPQSPTRPGRQGQHQEDVERDEVLAQKVRIYGWVKEEHLDIKPIGEKGRKFMSLAQQELLKIRSYRAPRDKVICILNSCKVIFGFLRNSSTDQSADSFIPLLIYVVLKANPDHLVSNVQYILRFRNQDKLGGEAGYYISSLMGAIQFIEGLDKTSLTISDEDFEKNVEAAVSIIAEPHVEEPAPPQLPQRNPPAQISEKSAPSRAEVTPRHSQEAEQVSPRKSQSSRRDVRSDDEGDDNALGANLLRTIQKPLSTIGRIFSDDNTSSTNGQTEPGSEKAPTVTERPSLDVPAGSRVKTPRKLSAEEVATRQASVDAEEARKLRLREEATLVETLSNMFPEMDKDVIQDVVRANDGR